MRWGFTALLCAVAACIVVFATGLDALARRRGWSRWPAWITAWMAVSAAGVGVFAFPHPLHNVFGLSELIGYQAPLVLVLAWRRRPDAARAVALSTLMAAVVWIAIAVNLVAIFRDPVVWPVLKPVYGVAQRALFASWFGWAVWLGLSLDGRRSA